MNIKPVWIFDPETRWYRYESFAQECRLEPGVWLTPENSTESRPHLDADGKEPEGKRNVLDADGVTWVLEDIPVITPVLSLRDELATLAMAYKSDIAELNSNWLSAAVADGSTETTRKTAVMSAISDRKTQYTADMTAVRAKYPTT